MIQPNTPIFPPPPELTLRDFLNVIFRHTKTMGFFFGGVVVLATVIAFKLPLIYESTAQLMIRIGRENATLDPTVSSGNAFNVIESRETEINSEIEVIRSREIAEKVVTAIGAEHILNIPPDDKNSPLPGSVEARAIREAAILAVMKNLSVQSLKKTNIISIAFTNQHPEIARDVLANLIVFYQEKHMAISRPASSYKFLEQQTDTLRTELVAKEDSLRNLKNETGIVSIAEQRLSILARLNALQLEWEQVNANLAASQAKIHNLEQTLASLPGIMAEQKITGLTSSSSDILRSKLNELRLKKQELLTKYSAKSRLVADLEQQINETAALLGREDYDSSRSSAARQIQMDLLAEQSNQAALSAKTKSVAAMLAMAKKELMVFNNNSVGLNRLQRQQEIDERNYGKYIDNLEQARIDHELKAENLSNVSIVQTATLPFKPIWPRKKQILLFGIALGLFGGLGLAFGREFLDHTIKTREDLEAGLALPVLGVIPMLDQVTLGVAGKIPASCGETLEVIRHMLLSNPTKTSTDPLVIAVTSSYPGEGTSTIARYLSETFVSHHDGGTVLLVDLNIQHPSLHAPFGIPLTPGFTDLYQQASTGQQGGPTPVNCFSQAPGVEVLPAGKPNQVALRLAESPRFSEILTTWKHQYGCIIFDVPCLAQSSMVFEVAKLIDGVVLIVEAERVRREVIKQSVSRLSMAGIRIFGAVLNKRKFYVPRFIYRKL